VMIEPGGLVVGKAALRSVFEALIRQVKPP
jgi:hypothetical protein